MRRLRDTPLNLTRRGAHLPPRKTFRAALVVLLAASAGLLVLERLNHPVIRDVRWRVSEWLTPLLTAASGPLAPLRWVGRQLASLAASTEELERLRSDSRRLAAAEGRASELERQLAEIAMLARVVSEQPIAFVSARVVGTSSGAFVRTLSINAGLDQSVRSGFPVVNGDGLVGRVVDAGRSAARVLLLTDLNSRVPVHVGKSAVRAILTGDNSARPRLEFISEGTPLAEGDEVVTSGVGGVFPRGLRIGRVGTSGRPLRVTLHVGLDDIEFVAVLQHRTTLGDFENELQPSVTRGGTMSRPLAGARSSGGIETTP
ncbi:MAG: rod shape-determining protein MreC [Hyphomicrobium sp.]